jgi:hypothetical protein
MEINMKNINIVLGALVLLFGVIAFAAKKADKSLSLDTTKAPEVTVVAEENKTTEAKAEATQPVDQGTTEAKPAVSGDATSQPVEAPVK